MTEPGSVSSPRDTEGDGPVDLSDRTEPGGQGSPDTNQAKAEPMPATPGEADPNAALRPPLLEDMNVGSADPQSPRHPSAAGSGMSVDEPVGTGPQPPVAATGGRSHHVPGMQGTTGPDESVETDVVSSAAQMGPAGPSSEPSDGTPGASQGVPVPSHDAAAGTSEEHAVVRGARTPEAG